MYRSRAALLARVRLLDYPDGDVQHPDAARHPIRPYPSYESLGFEREGLKRKVVFSNGRYKDVVVMGRVK